MFSVYSRYCRFFVDDMEMLEMYGAEVDRYEIAGKSTINLKTDIAIIKRKMHSMFDIQWDIDNKTGVIDPLIVKRFEVPEVNKKIYWKHFMKIRDMDMLEYSDIWFMNDHYPLITTYLSPVKLNKSL